MDTVRRITLDKPDVYAFEIMGKISSDAMEAMAKIMNDAFDKHDEKIDMMLVFIDFDGSESGALLDGDVISSRFRSLTNVDKYVVVGAPQSASTMLEMFGKLIPVDARTYELFEIEQAYELLGASRVSTTL